MAKLPAFRSPTLVTQAARASAYLTLAPTASVPTTPTEDEIDAILSPTLCFESYAERSSAVTDAAAPRCSPSRST
jgi:glycerol dehydrogenase-like iron-containing ADH family enzyme